MNAIFQLTLKPRRLHGVWTSLKDLMPEQVYTHYGELWRIEEGFRVLKHTMAVRPVFHWVERRVHAHIAICFVAFALLRIPLIPLIKLIRRIIAHSQSVVYYAK